MTRLELRKALHDLVEQVDDLRPDEVVGEFASQLAIVAVAAEIPVEPCHRKLEFYYRHFSAAVKLTTSKSPGET